MAKNTKLKPAYIALLSGMLLASIVLGVLVCQPFVPKEHKEYAAKLETDYRTAGRLLTLLDTGDKNEALTDEEWAQLERLAQSDNVKVRRAAVISMAGISYKKTTQPEKVIHFLNNRMKDESMDVRLTAVSFLQFFDEELAATYAAEMLTDPDPSVREIAQQIVGDR